MRKRWKALSICLAVIMTLLAGRLAYIQLLGQEDLSAAAHVQQQITLEGADTRGAIYDRNGTPLAGQQQEYIYIIEEESFDGETMNALNQVYAEEVPNEDNQYRVFTSQLYLKSTGERLIRNSGAFILEAGRRYQHQQTAVHMIGYTNPKDGSGATGLELQYDEVLSQYNKKVAAVADVQGKLLQGKGLAVTSNQDQDNYVKDGITTTLESGLQKAVEEILAQQPYDGAAVVTEVKTGQILAAASTPVYDPVNVESYMESQSGELINKVTQGQYPPGSIFKMIVAAAALEMGIDPYSVYTCNGAETVNGQTVKCSTGGETGHGTITLKDAFAKSCNCAFIQLGQQIGAEAILSMAENMGLGETVLNGYPGEKSGNLMTSEQSQGAAIANLSIGQGELLVTPLQAARVTGIIANDGLDTGLQLVLEQEEILEGQRCISQETAENLQEMMAQTMIDGTGSQLESDVSMAAKTGSAESVQAGSEVVHGWICGYVPAEAPQYAITVFMEDGKSGSGSAGPVFASIAQYLGESGLLENEVGF